MANEVTLMEAYLIEALKGSGMSREELLSNVQQKRATFLKESTNSDFDFTLLYEIEDRLEFILQNGYRVKFLTFPGLQRLLLLQVDKEADLDYNVDEFTIRNLHLTKAEAEKVRTFLSTNWELMLDGSSYVIKSK